MTLGALLDALVASRVATADEVAELRARVDADPALVDPGHPGLRLMVGCGAWFAALSFFACLGGVVASFADTLGVPVGLALVGLGVAAVRALPPRAEALRQVALATRATGMVALVAGLVEGLDLGVTGTALSVLGLEAAVIAAWNEPIGRGLSVWVIAGALIALIADADASTWPVLVPTSLVAVYGAVVAGQLAREQAYKAGLGGMWRPVLGAAHVVALVWPLGLPLARLNDVVADEVAVPLHPALMTALLFVTGVVIGALHHRAGRPIGALAGLGLLALAPLALVSPGLLVAVGLLLLGLDRREPFVIGTSLVAMVGWGGWTYYALLWPFSAKAAAMAATGAALLAGRAWLRATAGEAA